MVPGAPGEARAGPAPVQDGAGAYAYPPKKAGAAGGLRGVDKIRLPCLLPARGGRPGALCALGARGAGCVLQRALYFVAYV